STVLRISLPVFALAMSPPKKERTASRNPSLVRGIGKFSTSKMYHKRGIWAIKAKHGGSFPRHEPKPASAAPAVVKPPKFYPADDVKTPIPNRRKPKPTKLRYMVGFCGAFVPSYTIQGEHHPGNRFDPSCWEVHGKEGCLPEAATFRTAFGYWLTQGPFKINGVPLRRVNQAYVIATSTKVDISGVNADKFDDKYFTKEKKKTTKKGEGEFFETDKEVSACTKT
ncbi:hypothetical protein BHM03_00024353, partial [Ensete ventricosum]